jgi:hypothetical protein
VLLHVQQLESHVLDLLQVFGLDPRIAAQGAGGVDGQIDAGLLRSLRVILKPALVALVEKQVFFPLRKPVFSTSSANRLPSAGPIA